MVLDAAESRRALPSQKLWRLSREHACTKIHSRPIGSPSCPVSRARRLRSTKHTWPDTMHLDAHDAPRQRRPSTGPALAPHGRASVFTCACPSRIGAFPSRLITTCLDLVATAFELRSRTATTRTTRTSERTQVLLAAARFALSRDVGGKANDAS